METNCRFYPDDIGNVINAYIERVSDCGFIIHVNIEDWKLIGYSVNRENIETIIIPGVPARLLQPYRSTHHIAELVHSTECQCSGINAGRYMNCKYEYIYHDANNWKWHDDYRE